MREWAFLLTMNKHTQEKEAKGKPRSYHHTVTAPKPSVGGTSPAPEPCG